MTCLLALWALAAFGAGGAGAEDDEPVAKPPPYGGGMGFPNIQGPDGSESYAWTVQLDDEQELLQVDDRTARVYFEDGHPAFTIVATAAHDAIGTSVPTTLAVSDGDVITLTVHHRAGNPIRGGQPFHYPIIAGVGWKGGFHTYLIEMPPGERPGPETTPKCVVPRLTGDSLGLARERLGYRGCNLGSVRGKRARGARVVKQFRRAGAELPAGAKVAVKLG